MYGLRPDSLLPFLEKWNGLMLILYYSVLILLTGEERDCFIQRGVLYRQCIDRVTHPYRILKGLLMDIPTGGTARCPAHVDLIEQGSQEFDRIG
jgi:hypothetical protein